MRQSVLAEGGAEGRVRVRVVPLATQKALILVCRYGYGYGLNNVVIKYNTIYRSNKKLHFRGMDLMEGEGAEIVVKLRRNDEMMR